MYKLSRLMLILTVLATFYCLAALAVKLGGLQFMLHADHAYDQHPWYPALARGE